MNKIQYVKSAWIICSIFLLLSLNSCADSLQDEHVYRIALQGFCSKKVKGYSFLQNTSTPLPKRTKLSTSSVGELNAEAMDDMYDRNKTITTLPASIACDQLKILSEAEILKGFDTKPKLPHSIAVDEDWAGFYETFPGVSDIVKVSMPGYSKDGKQAVIYLQSVCGSLCGGGSFMQYKNVNGAWLYDKTSSVWTT